MNSIAGRIRRIWFFLAGALAILVFLAVSACGPVTEPAATSTPVPPETPAGWVCYQNETYGFEVCYPAASLLTTASDAHSRIDLAYLSGTNLVEKWMDVDSREGLADCASPQAEGYAAGSLDEETRTINGLEFFVQSGENAGAGKTRKQNSAGLKST